MNVTVFGASGKVGRLVVQLLLEDGHTVTAFVHSDYRFDSHPRLTVTRGDVHDARAVAQAIMGSDAVISTLGSWHTPTKDILSAAFRGITLALPAASNVRIISLTGSAATAPSDTLGISGKAMHRVFSFVAKDIINDAEVHLRLLADSNLSWTVLRASIMRSGARSDYTLSSKSPGPVETINRSAVARAIVEQLVSNEYLRQAPHLHQAR